MLPIPPTGSFSQIALIALIGVSIGGCGNSAPQAQAPVQGISQALSAPDWLSSVKSIQQVTSQDNGDTTRVAGVVRQQVPLVEQWLYQIEDASGSLWVLTPSPPPSVGSQVTLEAQIHYESVLMEGAEVGEHYAIEVERLAAVEAEPTSAPNSPALD